MGICQGDNPGTDEDNDDVDTNDGGVTDLEDEAFNDTGLMDHLDILDIYTVPDDYEGSEGSEEVRDNCLEDESENEWEDIE